MCAEHRGKLSILKRNLTLKSWISTIYTGDNREGDKNFDGKSLATETMFLFFGGPSHALNLQTFLMESEF